MATHRLRVEPAGVEIAVKPGQSILDAAQHSGILWPTVCNGGGTCMTCHFLVEDGEGHVVSEPEGGSAKKALDLIRRRYSTVPPSHVRLACQTTLTGDAKVFCKKARPQP